MDSSQSTLRNRKPVSEAGQDTTATPTRDLPADAAAEEERKEIKKAPTPLGKTPDGTIFPIPVTHDVLSSLFSPFTPKSHIDILILSLLSSQLLLFAFLPTHISQKFFLVYFCFWRLGYDVGLGYVLRRQSEERWIVNGVREGGWMDIKRRPRVTKWVKEELKIKMGKDYDFDSVPLEYNVWILFRHSVDVILLNDFLSYFFFGLAHLTIPPNHSMIFHVLRWIGGITLIAFNVWVKVDAHRIVKDYAWYWGDAFFLSLQNLVFDGVFEFAPHPMYSVGYAGYYGLSLIVASETVLFVSMAAHMCQFGFLVYFENPHIERTYGERKPLAARTPLFPLSPAASTPVQGDESPRTESDTEEEEEGDLTTPSLTTGTRTPVTETDPETETELDEDPSPVPKRRRKKESRGESIGSLGGIGDVRGAEFRRRETRHDLDNRYFRKDMIVGSNFDIFRTTNLSFLLVIFYSSLSLLLPSLSLSPTLLTSLYFLHSLLWRLFHSIALGLALQAQSERKWLVRHFLKHYHYEQEGGAVEEAFMNWKGTYNLSLCMSYASYALLGWNVYSIPEDWTVGSILVRHAMGIMLIALHIWTAQSTFEALGSFGWFYGDMFIEDYPAELYYTGIFRFLNNPERSMGGAAFFGLVLISGSKLMLVQAVLAVFAHWWFLSKVENPHMQRLYGKALRKDAGVTKTLKNVAKQNAHVLGGFTKNVKEVQGTVEKVFEETAEAVEEFLNRSKPKFSEYMEDTKILLKQTGERFVISRVANDLGAYDQSHYSLHFRPSTHRPTVPHASTSSAPARFHLGESITLDWQAPSNHSRKDWIGIYRLGANKSKLVTRVSSQGHWVGVNSKEWTGDVFEGNTAVPKEDSKRDQGTAVLSGKRLPWTTGLYEIRYHHDGKHSVMAISAPIEIFVEKPADANDPQSVYSTLTTIVAETLAFDPAAIPASARHLIPAEALESTPSSSSLAKSRSRSSSNKSIVLDDAPALSDPDDFVIYSLDEADHIAYAIKESFDIELDKEVVLAAANVGKLASRIIEARRLLRPGLKESTGKDDKNPA